jgi:hypothetical protein
MDPFESEKVHSRATGLVENWRLKLTRTPEWQQSLGSSLVLTPTPAPAPAPPTVPTPPTVPAPLSVRSTSHLSFSLYLLLTSRVTPRLRILANFSQFRGPLAAVAKELSLVSRTFPPTSAQISATRTSASSSGTSLIPRNHGATPVSRNFNAHTTKFTLPTPDVYGSMMRFTTR